MDNLEIKVGSEKVKGYVTEISISQILRKNQELTKKVVMSVIDTVTKNKYYVSDAFVDYKNEICIRALWLYEYEEGINPKSTLAQLMNFYNVKSVKDLKGKEILLLPDTKNFLVAIATEKL